MLEITPNMLKGKWPNSENAAQRQKRIFYAKIGFLAAATIALYIAGGLLVGEKPVVGGALLGLGTIGLVTCVVVLMRHNKKEEPRSGIPATYKILTWNMGTEWDHRFLLSLQHKITEGKELAQAVTEAKKEGIPPDPTEEQTSKRKRVFQELFASQDADIICLQESAEISDEELATYLPQDYNWHKGLSFDRRNCRVIWKSSKFTELDRAHLLYHSRYVPSLKPSEDVDALLLLRDNEQGTTLCVNSAHLRGFDLNYNQLKEDEKAQQLVYAQAGDHQLEYDLATMNDIGADLYIVAGDYNVTEEHYPMRHALLGTAGYTTDHSDTDPTIYDMNLGKFVKLDHIWARGRKQGQRYAPVTVQTITTDINALAYLSDFNRPSDHRFVMASVTVS